LPTGTHFSRNGKLPVHPTGAGPNMNNHGLAQRSCAPSWMRSGSALLNTLLCSPLPAVFLIYQEQCRNQQLADR
jgi:hypothetical protein